MISNKNVQEWIKLIEVDWLGQYAKAWIAFNAWYRQSIGSETDRVIIDKIKDGEQGICSSIESHLSGTGVLDKTFQADFVALHNSLFNGKIESKGRKISFEAIEDYKYFEKVETDISNISYNIKLNDSNRTDRMKRLVTVINSSGKKILDTSIKRGDEQAILDDKWFTSFFSSTGHTLSNTQQETLKGLLKESSPIHTLLSSDKDNIEIEGYQFINNQNQIARAIIEVLYQLRNTLFHGEITPTQEIQKAYEPAYLILKRIILLVGQTSIK